MKVNQMEPPHGPELIFVTILNTFAMDNIFMLDIIVASIRDIEINIEYKN